MDGKDGNDSKGVGNVSPGVTEDPSIKKYPLSAIEPTDIDIPRSAAYIEIGTDSVTLYIYPARPDEMKSTICEIPNSWIGKTKRFIPKDYQT